jgi:hypothetical protein
MCFVVIDTESSVCHDTNIRILVSFAYEVVADDGDTVRASCYDLVALPPGIRLDRRSQRCHGITPSAMARRGRALFHILRDPATIGVGSWSDRDFVDTMTTVQPTALVGHDVVGDAVLLVSEALRVGLPAAHLRDVFLRLLCTKQLAVGRCCIPLPHHLRYDFPCDAMLHRLNGDARSSQPPAAYKWPNLDECYRMLVGSDEAEPPRHDARGDVERCRRVLSRFLGDHRTP